MDTTYHRRTTRATHRSQQTKPMTRKGRRRLGQLALCGLLLFGMLVGRRVAPDQVEVGLKTTLNADTDFVSAFAAVGQQVEEGGGLGAALEKLWQGIRGGEASPTEAPQPTTVVTTFPVVVAIPSPTVAPTAPVEPSPTPTPYTGEPLPDYATMEHLELGLAYYMPPVAVALSSEYGWRTHPVDGEERFHSGVDLVASEGTPVAAFGDGTVDYIGEDDQYGLYLQLKHDNGVTSFYAHCSELLVQAGDKVDMGDTVAKVGQSGNVTAPHLHFELKKDGILVNPVYYL